MTLAVLVAVCASATPREVLHDAGLNLVGDFDEEEVRALADGVLVVPPRLWPGVEKPVTLRRVEGESATGLAEPEWKDGELQLVGQRGAVTWRDATLDAPERRRLWRARAAVHAIIASLDRREHLSARLEWRRIAGWLEPFERPLTFTEHALNRHPDAFARPRGGASAHLDLVTFAEAFFVPVTELPEDELVRCQELTRSRVLARLLGVPRPDGDCPAFADFARERELDGVEVLFVQSSGRRPESLFGHVLLWPRWRDERGPSFTPVVQLSALTEPSRGPVYLAKGVFGGYFIGVFTQSLADVLREKRSSEQRTLHRFRLALTHDESVRVLERVWELERRGRFDYAFFSDNCASLLLWVLAPALDEPELASWPLFASAPAAVLDDLAAARRRDGRPLLEPVVPAFESTGARAARSARRRGELEEELASGSEGRSETPVSPSGVDGPRDHGIRSVQTRSSTSLGLNGAGLLGPTELLRVNGSGPADGRVLDFSAAHDERVAVRAGAYRALARATAAAPPSTRAAWFDWWAHSARVERARADEASRTLDELDAARRDSMEEDPDAAWDARRQLFQRESALARETMILDAAQHARDLSTHAKRRPPTEDETRAESDARATLALFEEVTSLQAALADGPLAGDSGAVFLARDARAQAQEEQARLERAAPTSGHFRASAGGGAWSPLGGHASPLLVLTSAGLADALGEERVRGLGALAGVRLLDASATFAALPEGPRLVEGRLTLVAFDSLVAPPPPTSALARHLGFGFDLSSDTRLGRSFATLSGARGFALFGAGGDGTLAALGVGPGAWVADTGHGLVPIAGGSAKAQARAPLWPGSRYALVAEARATLALGASDPFVELEAEAAFELVASAGRVGRVALRPTLRFHTEPFLDRGAYSAAVMVELLPPSFTSAMRP